MNWDEKDICKKKYGYLISEIYLCCICNENRVIYDRICNIAFLWNDLDYRGIPICFSCYELIAKYKPERLNAPMDREIMFSHLINRT